MASDRQAARGRGVPAPGGDDPRTRQPAVLSLDGPPAARGPSDTPEDWSRLLDVVGWLQRAPAPRHPRAPDGPAGRAQQVRGVPAPACSASYSTAPFHAESIDTDSTGAAGFARRYGFLDRPERIRFRILDPAHALVADDRTRSGQSRAGGQDVTLDATTFAALDTGVSRVFVTENEVNFLAFPGIEGGMVVFGAGYGFDSLRRAQWLSRCRLFYWGDIDTHGFAILDELRGHFGRVESFLMDSRDVRPIRAAVGGGEIASRPGSAEADRRRTRPLRRPPVQPHGLGLASGAGTHRVRVGQGQSGPPVDRDCLIDREWSHRGSGFGSARQVSSNRELRCAALVHRETSPTGRIRP